MAKRNYKVTTRDVDGSYSRSYSTWERAAKRFEEMAGFPLLKGRREWSSISDYGTVVEFQAAFGAEVPAYPEPESSRSQYDDEGYENLPEFYQEPPLTCDSLYATYGGAEHQMYGDSWLYADCPGAW